MVVSFLLSFAFPFFSQLFVRRLRQPFCLFAFLFLGDGLDHSSYAVSQSSSIVLQAFCLSDLIPLISLSLLLYNLKGFDLGPT